MCLGEITMTTGPTPALIKLINEAFNEFRGDKVLNKDTYWKLVEHRDRL